jgi:hypothetical protein
MNGSLNQYNEVMRYSFYVDSNRRSSGTNTDLNLNLSQPITRMATDSQYIVSVTSVSVPFSFYQLSATDNLNQLPVYLKNNLDVAGRFTTITLQQGNYTPYTLLTQLNSKLVEACQQIGISGFTPFTPVFASTYNPTTGFITFSVTGPVGCEIVLRFSLTTVTQQLSGFFGVHGVDVTMTPTTTQSSTKPCVLNPVNYLYLRSSLKQFRNREWVVKTDDVSDILQRIPIGTSQGTWIQYDQPSEPVYIIDDSIDTINFYLTTNLTYEAINIQGIDWSFAFTISEVVRPRYTPITQQIVYNSFAPATGEDKAKELADLEAQKQKELERLKRYRERLATGTPEEDLKKAETSGTLPVGPTGTTQTPTVSEERTPETVLKEKGLLNPSVAKMEEFQRIQYGSLWDDPVRRPVGDVLGVALNPVVDTTEETPSSE